MQMTAQQFEQFVRQNSKLLAGFLKVHFPNLSHEDLEDIAQEALLKFWKTSQANKLNPNQSLPGLLCTIAKRKAIDHIREKGRKVRTTPLPESDEEYMAMVAEFLKDTKVGEAWQHLAHKELAKTVLEEFRELVKQSGGIQQEVGLIMSQNLENPLSNKEIAAILTKPGKTRTEPQVKSATFELRCKFREIMERELKKKF